MKTPLAILLSLALLSSFSAHAGTDAELALPRCERPWVFFDVGDTLIDTSTFDFNPMFYTEHVRNFEDGKLYRTSRDYIDALKAAGYVVGAIMDVPESWGPGYPSEAPLKDAASAKILRTFDFIEGLIPADESRWVGQRMDWAPFGRFEGSGADRIFVGRMFLPQNNSERKKSGSTILFDRALKLAHEAGCSAVYQGEAADEMILAERAGISAFQVGKTDPRHFFLPIEKIPGYAKKYHPGSWTIQIE